MSELTIGSIGTRLDLELRAGNTLGPYTLSFKDSAGAAVAGDKSFFLPYNDGGTELLFLYTVRHSAADLTRMLLI